MKIKHLIQLTEAETTNIKNGLELLKEKCGKKIAEIPPNSDGADEMRSYFSEKQKEISQQITGFNSLLKK